VTLLTTLPLLELWIVVTLGAVALKTTSELLQKHLLADTSAFQFGWATSLVSAAVLLPLGSYSLVQTAAPRPAVIGLLLVGGTVEVAALYVWLEALKADDISLVSPLRNLVPVFVVVFEPLLLTVPFAPDVAGGAALTALGAYIALVDRADLTSPLRRISDRGPKLALAAAVLYALASVISKAALDSVTPLLYATSMFVFIALGFTVIGVSRARSVPTALIRRPPVVLVSVVTAAVGVVVFTAFSLAPSAAEVTVVLRLSLLANVVLGVVLFREEGLLTRGLGSLLIVAGIALATL
jgi:drug/metabolite transporter (DMT)-like permease